MVQQSDSNRTRICIIIRLTRANPDVVERPPHYEQELAAQETVLALTTRRWGELAENYVMDGAFKACAPGVLYPPSLFEFMCCSETGACRHQRAGHSAQRARLALSWLGESLSGWIECSQSFPVNRFPHAGIMMGTPSWFADKSFGSDRGGSR